MESSAEDILVEARRILDEEAAAILEKSRALGPGFVSAVRRLLLVEGLIVVTGVGKSGIIGEKIAATFSSTGTPSFFLRPVDALHGDLGMISSRDVLLAISASGETAEV